MSDDGYCGDTGGDFSCDTGGGCDDTGGGGCDDSGGGGRDDTGGCCDDTGRERADSVECMDTSPYEETIACMDTTFSDSAVVSFDRPYEIYDRTYSYDRGNDYKDTYRSNRTYHPVYASLSTNNNDTCTFKVFKFILAIASIVFLGKFKCQYVGVEIRTREYL